MGEILIDSMTAGTRAATRVRVINAGTFEGWRGYVVRVHRAPGIETVFVGFPRRTFDGLPGRLVLPFARSELRIIEGG